MTIELHQDDVWWMGIVLRKSPAGVFVYTPGAQRGTGMAAAGVAWWGVAALGLEVR
jgi:hypothetical protein